MSFNNRYGNGANQVPVDKVCQSTQVDRRNFLGIVGAASVISLAGCMGDTGDQDDTSSPITEEPWPPSEARVGGSLSVAVPFEQPGRDPAIARPAGEQMITPLLYDNLVQFATRGGETYNWLAKSTTQTTGPANFWPADYLEYARAYEIVNFEGSEPQFDLNKSNLVLAIHPDDETTLSNQEFAVGDSVRLLTRTEAAAAAMDGRYATKLDVTLWEGIHFHNGEELTAGNVISSYDRLAQSDLAAEQFESFLAAEAPDGPEGYEVTLYAHTPVIFPGLALQPLAIFPSAHLDLSPGALDPGADKIPIGCGPYRVAEWESEKVRLVQYEDYWLKDVGLSSFEWWNKEDAVPQFPNAPVVEEVSIEQMGEYNTRYTAITTDEVDVAFGFTPEDLSKFLSDDEYDEVGLSATGDGETAALQLPVAAETETPLAIQECRQAIAAAISREQLFNSVNEWWAGPALVPVPPEAYVFEDRFLHDLVEEPWVPSAEANLERAKNYLDASDLATPVEFTIAVDMENAKLGNLATELAESLSETGYFAVDVQPTAAILDQSSFGDPHIVEEFAEHNAALLIEGRPGYDPDAFVREFHHPESFGSCCNHLHPPGTFDWIDAIDEANRELAQQEPRNRTTEVYIDLWMTVIETAGTIYLLDSSSPYVFRIPNINNAGPSSDPDTRLERLLYNPYQEDLGYIDDEDLPLLENTE